MDLITRASYRERDFGKQIKGVGSCIGASLALTEIHGGSKYTTQSTFDTVYNPVITCLGLKEGMPAYVLNRILNSRDSRAAKANGNPFRTGASGANIQRARLSILLRVIIDTCRNFERRSYPFENMALLDVKQFLEIAHAR
jgi:hypothetical protein